MNIEHIVAVLRKQNDIGHMIPVSAWVKLREILKREPLAEYLSGMLENEILPQQWMLIGFYLGMQAADEKTEDLDTGKIVDDLLREMNIKIAERKDDER